MGVTLFLLFLDLELRLPFFGDLILLDLPFVGDLTWLALGDLTVLTGVILLLLFFPRRFLAVFEVSAICVPRENTLSASSAFA